MPNCNKMRLRDHLKEIDDFEVIGPIGQGSFGTVFKARDKKTKAIYAKKEIFFDPAENKEDNYEYFFREVTSLFSFSFCKGIPLLSLIGFAFPTETSAAFILTEYIDGGDVYKVTKSRTITPQSHPTEMMKIVYGTAFGLYFLHKNKLIHRDIKPGNILLTKSYEPIIADFGFVKLAEKVNKTIKIGTYQYMAPEIYEDDNYDTSVDCYSFGVVVLELFTDHLEYENTHQSVVNSIQSIEKAKKGERLYIPNNVPNDYRNLIDYCTRLNPSERWSMEDIVRKMKQGSLHLEGCDDAVFGEYVRKLDKAGEAPPAHNTNNEEESTEEFMF